MNDRPTNEEHEALIAGDRTALTPDEAAELTLLADLLANPSTWTEPSAGLEDAVVHAVAVAPQSAGRTAAPATIEVGHDAKQHRGRVFRATIAAVAAVAAVTLGIGAVLATSGTNPNYTAQLSSTALAPGAHASADITRNRAGFRVSLDASGLPALQAHEYYQAWLKNATGTLVPIGTFSSSDGHVTLWSGVSPTDFPTLSVTIEATDNDQTSSGRRVLVGTVHAK